MAAAIAQSTLIRRSFARIRSFLSVVPAETGVPRRVFDVMLRIHWEGRCIFAQGPACLGDVFEDATYPTGEPVRFLRGDSGHHFSVSSVHLDRLRPFFPLSGGTAGTGFRYGELPASAASAGRYFMRFFKRVTGLSFMEYLNHYRIERAQTLLANTDDSMASISQEMGFCDQSYSRRSLPQSL